MSDVKISYWRLKGLYSGKDFLVRATRAQMRGHQRTDPNMLSSYNTQVVKITIPQEDYSYLHQARSFFHSHKKRVWEIPQCLIDEPWWMVRICKIIFEHYDEISTEEAFLEIL